MKLGCKSACGRHKPGANTLALRSGGVGSATLSLRDLEQGALALPRLRGHICKARRVIPSFWGAMNFRQVPVVSDKLEMHSCSVSR